MKRTCSLSDNLGYIFRFDHKTKITKKITTTTIGGETAKETNLSDNNNNNNMRKDR